MRRVRQFPWLIAAMFLFSLFIAYHIPYTHDDWDWGRQIGVSNWLSATFNNRYVGTFFVVLLTRFPAAKVLIMALVMTALPLICAELGTGSGKDRPRRWMLALACFVSFSMPRITWRQTYGWVAGFSNFTLGACAMLALLSLLQYLRRRGLRRPWLGCASIFLFSFAAQLFAENISAILPFFLVCAMVLIRCWRDRDTCRIFVSALLGTVLGAVIIFFNPLYRELATTGAATEQFRVLTFSPNDPVPVILSTMLKVFFGEVLPTLYETHPILVLFLCAAVWIDLSGKGRGPALGLCIPMAVYGVWCCYCAAQMGQTYGWIPSSALLRSAGAFLFSVLLLISFLCSPRREKWRTLAFFFLAVLLTTPFAAIARMGPRCYHASHFCLLVAGLSCCTRARPSLRAKGALAAGLLVCVLCLVHVYSVIGSCNALRAELTRQALDSGASTLVLPSMDGTYSYFWGYNPQNALRADHYREYYGLPGDLELIFLPYGSAELWPDIPQQMYSEAMIYP